MIGLLILSATAAAPAPMADLNGEWRTLGDRPIHVSYRSISNESATVERWRTPSGRETMTVFSRDSGAVLATHYCAQGNVATLAAPLSENPQVFSFRSAYGVDPGEGVLVNLSLVRDGDRLRRVETYRTGGRDEVETIEFVRAAD